MQLANVGSMDRLIRLVLGAVLLVLPLFGMVAAMTSTLGMIMIIVGVILIATALFSFCPLYRLIGARTNAKG